jgi:hypothetical protein
VDTPRVRTRARVHLRLVPAGEHLFHFPSLLFFAAANALLLFGSRFAWPVASGGCVACECAANGAGRRGPRERAWRGVGVPAIQSMLRRVRLALS